MKFSWNQKKPEAVAAVAALASGIAAHCFALVNILHNYDNILQQPTGYGAGITSGRWLLSVLGDICENILDLGYNFPVVNGLAYLALIALSAALVVRLLKISRPVSAALAGCLMATFPTVCVTLLFRFTSGYYGLCLLAAVLAAWAVWKPKYGILLSALFTACSLGIYQAYTPVTIGLMVLMLLRESLMEGAELKKLVKDGIRCCAALVLGLVFYFVFLKLSLAVYGVELDSYLGINEMGKIPLSELPFLLKKTWMDAVFFPLKNYCGLASVRMLKVLWTLLLMLTVVLAVFLMVKCRVKLFNGAFCCLMGLLVPIAVNFQVIMSPQGVYTMMVHSFALLGCAPLMLLELLGEPEGKSVIFRRTAGVLLAGIVFYNGYYANFHYTALYYSNRQVENYFSGMVAQMRMTEGFTPDKTWAFLGENRDPMFYDIWDTTPRYGGALTCSAKELINVPYSFASWFHNYLGLNTRFASQEEENALWRDDRVAQMPCWPAQGSMQVVDDYLVVKFQEMP